MQVLRTVLSIIYILICIVLVVVVLMQEGKQSGLGALSGTSEGYWSKNKGRSAEGKLVKITSVLGALFIILSIVLCMNMK